MCISLTNSPLVLTSQLQVWPLSLLSNGIFFLKFQLEFLVNENFSSPPRLGPGEAGQPLFPRVMQGGLLSPLQSSAIRKDTEKANTTGFFVCQFVT